MSRDRFPVSAEAVTAVLDAHEADTARDQILTDLHAAAPHLVRAWIDALTPGQLLLLRFNPVADWCQQMRAELRRLTEETM